MLTLHEILDLGIMTFFIGFLFSDLFPRPARIPPLNLDLPYTLPSRNLLNWENIKYAALIAAPGIILHELAHKFVANAFGLPATFHAFYADPTIRFIGILAIILKLSGSGFFLVVPGFVTHPAAAPLINAVIAFSGPFLNFVLWFITWAVLKYRKIKNETSLHALIMTKKLNLLLFGFNMIPIPGFDGFQVFSSLLSFFLGSS